MLQTAEEVRQMVRLGAERGVEVNLSVGPPAPCDISAQQPGAADRTQELSLRGADELAYALEEVRYACGSGIRSVRVSDLGVLATNTTPRISWAFSNWPVAASP